MDQSNSEAVVSAPVKCNRCGRVDLDAKLKVSEDTMKEYLRCALGNRPFTKTISIQGVFDFVFESLPADVELDLERYVNKHELTMDMTSVDLRTLMTLAKVNKYDEDTGETSCIYVQTLDDRKELLKNPENGFKQLIKHFDGALLGVLRRAGLSFLLLCGAIVEEMVDEDFYEGVGLL